MICVYGLYPAALENTAFRNRTGAARPFLRRLKDEQDGTVDVFGMLGYIADRDQEHRHMTVVTAGMHHAGMLRRPVRLRRFGYAQSVHVSAYRTGRKLPAVVPGNKQGDAGIDNRFRLISEFLQVILNKRLCPRLVKSRFRYFVKLPPKPDGLVHIGF